MDLQTVYVTAGIASAVVIVFGSLIAGLVWVIAHRAGAATDAKKDLAQTQLVSTLEAQRDAYKLERDELAAKVPGLESKLNALRDEVGATKVIADMRQDVAKGFERISTMLANHEERAQRADRQQAEWNRASTRLLNDMAARLHLSSIIEIEAPPATPRTVP